MTNDVGLAAVHDMMSSTLCENWEGVVVVVIELRTCLEDQCVADLVIDYNVPVVPHQPLRAVKLGAL